MGDRVAGSAERPLRVVHLAAGAGAMYCGACAHDAALVRGMVARGHDVQMVPLYTPLRLDGGAPLPTSRVFLGGINAYLEQASLLFRHTPAWLEGLLDNEALLRWVSRFAVTVNPAELGPMTVSVLHGREGRQRREIDKLLHYLEHIARPDLLSITNSLLSAIAPEVKARLGVPVVCSVQGEDAFVAAMPEPFRSEARGLIQRHAASIDLFLSPGEAYADVMSGFLAIPRDRMRVVRVGVETGDYAPAEAPAAPTVVGYLSVIHRPKGLDLLVEAMGRLVTEQEREVLLRVAGRPLDMRYWRGVQRALRDAGLEGRFQYAGEVDRAGKIAFLHGCHVFCAPTRVAESRGVAVLEAMACGVPVVAPRAGIFPEIADLTGGAALFEPGEAGSLAAVLGGLLDRPAERAARGRAAREGVLRGFAADTMVERTLAEYRALVARRTAGAAAPSAAPTGR